MTIVVDGDYAIEHGQTLHGVGIMFRLEQSDESRPTTFDNAGKIFYAGGGSMVVQTDPAGTYKSFVFSNEAKGVFEAMGGSSLIGFSLQFKEIEFSNAGRFHLSSGGIGIGVLAQGTMEFHNTGTFAVEAPNAVGVGSDFGHLSNEGELTVSGSSVAIGLRLNDHGSVLNAGDLTVTATGDAVGVYLDSGEQDFRNSGRIGVHSEQAGKAVGVEFHAFTTLTSFSNTGSIVSNGFALLKPDDGRGGIGLDIANDGTIEGTVSLGRGDDHFVNRGEMTGDVLLGVGDDSFLAAQGQFTGQVFGGAGDDLVIGGKQGDFLFGDDAAAGKDDGSDQLDGGKGDDVLDGGAGNDGLTGGRGADVLIGGGGDDAFIYRSVNQSLVGREDVISDLSQGDTINLSLVDADTTARGHQHFVQVGSLDGHAGEAALVYDAGTDVTRLQLDVDGDGQADAVIMIDGDHHEFDGLVL